MRVGRARPAHVRIISADDQTGFAYIVSGLMVERGFRTLDDIGTASRAASKNADVRFREQALGTTVRVGRRSPGTRE